MSDDLFRQKVDFLLPALQKDLDITKEQAAGIIGSLAAETGGFKYMQEIKPRGHRGGWGWAQWTGPRRKDFEKKYGVGNRSDEANYGMLVGELKNDPYWKKELRRLKRTETVSEAARTFTGSAKSGRGYLRPGVEHYDESEMWAKQALKVSEPLKMAITGDEEVNLFQQYEKTLQLISLTRIVDVDEVNTIKLRAVINAARDTLEWKKVEENNT